MVNTAKKPVNSRHCCHAPMVALDGKSKSRVSYGSPKGQLYIDICKQRAN